jgi:hypothetical protein
VILSHQYFKQFEDQYILDAILNLTKVKIFFNIPSRADRDILVKNMYGGDISDREASWTNSDLPKQHCVIKIGKQPPKRIRIPDVKNVDYNINIEELIKDYDQRRENPVSSESGAKPKYKTTQKRNKPKISNTDVGSKSSSSTKDGGKDFSRAWDTASMESPKKDEGK